jgi:hypothetical protein
MPHLLRNKLIAKRMDYPKSGLPDFGALSAQVRIDPTRSGVAIESLLMIGQRGCSATHGTNQEASGVTVIP